MKQAQLFNKENLFFLLITFLLALYVLYEHYSSSLAVSHTVILERHENMLLGKSEFYNPWQYRILYVFVLEGIRKLMNIILGNSGNLMVPFLILKFIQIMAIFYLSNYYYKLLDVKSNYLRYLGLIILTFGMSNSVFKADFAFNTYFDIIFYLLAGIAVLSNRYWFILLITFFAALNRETSAFIPFMLAPVLFTGGARVERKNVLLIASVSLLLFGLVFVGLRLYYGYQMPVGIHEMKSMMDYLKFNLTFFRMYPQWLGTFSVLPILTLLGFSSLPKKIRYWVVLIVPIWFLIHLVKSTAVESRLFLVPTALLFVPAVLIIVQASILKNKA